MWTGNFRDEQEFKTKEMLEEVLSILGKYELTFSECCGFLETLRDDIVRVAEDDVRDSSITRYVDLVKKRKEKKLSGFAREAYIKK